MKPLRPYLIRAIYDWIADSGLTPHLLVDAKQSGVVVPKSYLTDGQIVLNCSSKASRNLVISDTAVDFDARFGLEVWHIHLPISSVIAIYAKENTRGISFSHTDEYYETEVDHSRHKKKGKRRLLSNFKLRKNKLGKNKKPYLRIVE